MDVDNVEPEELSSDEAEVIAIPSEKKAARKSTAKPNPVKPEVKDESYKKRKPTVEQGT